MPKPERRIDSEGYPGVVPSRQPEAAGDPRAHHEFGAGNSVNHHPDPRSRNGREYDPSLPGIDSQGSRCHSDATRRDDHKARVRDDVNRHLQDHRGR